MAITAIFFQLQTLYFSKYLLFATVDKEHLIFFFFSFFFSVVFLQLFFKGTLIYVSLSFQPGNNMFGAELLQANLPGVLNTGGIPAAL